MNDTTGNTGGTSSFPASSAGPSGSQPSFVVPSSGEQPGSSVANPSLGHVSQGTRTFGTGDDSMLVDSNAQGPGAAQQPLTAEQRLAQLEQEKAQLQRQVQQQAINLLSPEHNKLLIEALTADNQRLKKQNETFQSKVSGKPPPTYTGASSDGDVREWFDSVEEHLDMNKVSIHLWVRTAATFLQKEAKRYYLSIRRELGIPTPLENLGAERSDESSRIAIPAHEAWAKFKHKMLVAFGNMQDEQHALNLLGDLRQTGSLHAYTQRFSQLVDRVVSEPMTEREKVRRLLRA